MYYVCSWVQIDTLQDSKKDMMGLPKTQAGLALAKIPHLLTQTNADICKRNEPPARGVKLMATPHATVEVVNCLLEATSTSSTAGIRACTYTHTCLLDINSDNEARARGVDHFGAQ